MQPSITSYKAFPDQAQPESHQLLHYRQHGPSSKGKEEEPRCREASTHPSTSKVDEFDDKLIQEKQTVPVAPKPQNRNPPLHGFKDDKLEDGK